MNRRQFSTTVGSFIVGYTLLPSQRVIFHKNAGIPGMQVILPFLQKWVGVICEVIVETIVSEFVVRTFFDDEPEQRFLDIERVTDIPAASCAEQKSFVLPIDHSNGKDFIYVLSPALERKIYQSQLLVPFYGGSLATGPQHILVLTYPAIAGVSTAIDDLKRKGIADNATLSKMFTPFEKQNLLYQTERIGLNVYKYNSYAGVVGIVYEVDLNGNFSGHLEFTAHPGKNYPKNYRVNFGSTSR
ncbi:MAG: hypothetical protein AAGJ82_02635 [Bacteroidota bacterium]